MAGSIRRPVAQQIVETVKDVCGRDVNFINADGMIFASTDPARTGTYHEVGRQVFQTGQIIEVESDNRYLGTFKGVNLPFVHHGEVAAVIGISGPPDEVRKFAYLAQRITGMILWEHDAGVQLRREENQLNYIIRALISNESVNPEFMLDFLKTLGVALDAEYRTVVFQLNTRYSLANLSLIESSIREAFRQAGSRLYTFHYPNEYLLILEDSRWRYWAAMFRQLAEEHSGVLQVGVGASGQLFRQFLSYRSAKLALQSLLEGQSIALFDELDLDLLLASVSRETKGRFLEKTIGALDEKERRILGTYFSCDMSLKQASERLFLHKNTLQYQLDRIARKTGYDPRSFRQAVILYLGLKLTQIDYP